MLDLEKFERHYDPFHFLLTDQAFGKDFLNELASTFPPIEEIVGSKVGRINFDATHPQFHKIISKLPAWNKLYNYLISPEYVNKMFAYFKEELQENESAFSEEQLKIGRPVPAGCSGPFFAQVALGKGYDEYYKDNHHDGSRRIINFLLYLNEPEQDGGDLILYRPTKPKKIHEQFNPTDVEEFHRIKPGCGKGMIWLSTPNSYHEVPLISNTVTPRHFIYTSITAKKHFAWTYGNKWIGDERLMKAYAKSGKK